MAKNKLRFFCFNPGIQKWYFRRRIRYSKVAGAGERKKGAIRWNKRLRKESPLKTWRWELLTSLTATLSEKPFTEVGEYKKSTIPAVLL
jgi:hypothetical protein